MVERLSAVVGARITEFQRKMAEVKAISKTLPNTIWITVKARTDAAEARLDALADTLRTFQTVGASMRGGAFLATLPASVPTLAALTAVLASMGPMLGVMGGGMLAMASTFSLAAVAAAGFGAAMYPLIFDIKNARSQILSGKKALEDFSKPMQHAQLGLIALKATFKNLTNAIEPHALQAIGTSMYVLADIITALKPGIVKVAKALEGMMTDLRGVVKNADDVQASFAWFNDRAASAVESWAKIAGYAFRGFVNLMRAFDPLAQSTEQGLLNMTKRFSEWTAGLSKSEKFQKFISYVRENGPKLLDIFGNITMGLVGMFTAFAPMSADMMTGLQKLTQRFQEWGQSLSQNKSFQEFISYVRENTPKVLSLISELTSFLINLAVGMAPLGSKILDIVTGFLGWSNSMMEAHPWMKKIFGSIIVITGVLKMIVPLILAASALFSGLGGNIAKMVTKAMPLFRIFKTNLIIGLKMAGRALLGFVVRMIQATVNIVSRLAYMAVQAVVHSAKFIGRLALMGAKYAWLGIKAMASAVRVAASFLVAMGPVGWVIATVIALVALIIWKWDAIKKWTVKTWNAVWSWIKDTWSKVWSKTKEIASNLLSTIREKWSEMTSAIREKMSEIWNAITDKWGQIKSSVRNKLSEIWKAVKQKFADMVDAVQENMNDVFTEVKNIWGNVKEFFGNIDLFDMGADIIRGLISGIGSMAGALVSKAKGIVGDAIGAAKNLLGINSPSRVFMEIGHFTGEGFAIGMEKTARMVTSASKAMTGASIPTPAMTKTNFDVNHHVLDEYESKEEMIIIEMSGREVARGTKKHMEEFMGRESKREVRFAWNSG